MGPANGGYHKSLAPLLPQMQVAGTRSPIPAPRADAPPSDTQYFARRSEGIRGCRGPEAPRALLLARSDYDRIVATRNYAWRTCVKHPSTVRALRAKGAVARKSPPTCACCVVRVVRGPIDTQAPQEQTIAVRWILRFLTAIPLTPWWVLTRRQRNQHEMRKHLRRYYADSQ